MEDDDAEDEREDRQGYRRQAQSRGTEAIIARTASITTRNRMLGRLAAGLIALAVGLWGYSLIRDRMELSATAPQKMSNTIQSKDHQVPMGIVPNNGGGGGSGYFMAEPETTAPAAAFVPVPAKEDTVDRFFDRMDRMVGSLAGVAGLVLLVMKILDGMKSKKVKAED
jgi:hypothetical protein